MLTNSNLLAFCCKSACLDNYVVMFNLSWTHLIRIVQLRHYCICIIIKSENWKLRHVKVSEFYFSINLEQTKKE